MIEFVFVMIFLLIAGLMTWHIWLRRKRVRAMNEDLGESPGWNDFVLVKYKGEYLPMTMAEKLNVWDLLERDMKREAAMKIRQGIKKGKLSHNILGHDQGLPVYEE